MPLFKAILSWWVTPSKSSEIETKITDHCLISWADFNLHLTLQTRHITPSTWYSPSSLCFQSAAALCPLLFLQPLRCPPSSVVSRRFTVDGTSPSRSLRVTALARTRHGTGAAWAGGGWRRRRRRWRQWSVRTARRRHIDPVPGNRHAYTATGPGHHGRRRPPGAGPGPSERCRPGAGGVRLGST